MADGWSRVFMYQTLQQMDKRAFWMAIIPLQMLRDDVALKPLCSFKPEMKERTVLYYEYKRTRNHLPFLVCFKMAKNIASIFFYE